MKITKTEIASDVAQTTGLSKKQALEVVEATFESITNLLVGGNEVSIYGFGIFSTVDKAERQAHNPKTLEKVTVPASRRVKFKVSSTLKKATAA